MLRLINVCKSYKFGKNKMVILDNINLDFKKKELVFILGTSGSGKSTLLNIIGGMLDVDSGCVMLDDKDITKFNNSMLCNYRNNMVGFIFQNYHLVEYMSVIDNIKLGQTIKNNGITCEDILRKLGIYSKRNTLVNKLSGGEKQRVAIARAIINDPEIILCDEPTGALDTANSVKIMKILKEISNEKLVIVVSHDLELASKYADRIIRINDGKVEYYPQIDDGKFRDIVKKKIGLFSIINLAIKNLGLKKGRTLFTSIAISIGFICMLLVLCLSKSFNNEINNLEKDIVSGFPINVYNGEFEVMDVSLNKKDDVGGFISRKNMNDYIHTNKIDNRYIDYVKEIDDISYIGYYYNISMPVISDRYNKIDSNYMKMIPSSDFISKNYDILYGSNISDINDIILKIDNNNMVDSKILDFFNIQTDISYEEIIGRKIRIILNNNYYVKNGNYYFINSNNEEIYKNSDFELEIVGIVKEKDVVDDNSYIYYHNDVIDYLINENSKSDIVLEQKEYDYNVLGIDMNKYELLSYLGYETLPSGLDIYVDDINSRKIVIDKLDFYNEKYSDDKLVYVDTMKDAIDILKNIINVITVILIIFSLISIFVACLMIFILTNNRIIERVREIGILRSLGARSRDITRLFNIENIIIGIISSVIGIGISYVLVSPTNNLLNLFFDDGDIFKIYIEIVISCIIFNIFIVVLSGYIPAKIAGRRKIIDCINGRV